MLNVRELRSLAGRLTEAFFCNQIGPFVVVQRPPRPVVEQMAMRMGAQSTMAASGTSLEAMQLAVMLRFDELVVATLPPLRSTDELMVGRMPSCDLVINDPSVSKEHARLVWNGRAENCTLVDLGSMNGTEINGHRLEPHKEFFVEDGDLIRFGDADFAYLTAESLWDRLRR